MNYTQLDPSALPPWTSVHPRALTPDFTAPPEPLDLPALPSAPRQPSAEIASRYVLTTHLVPAAYPRSTRAVEMPECARQAADFSLPKDVRVAKTQETLDFFSELHNKAPRSEPNPDTRVLWNVVSRYLRKDGRAKRGKGLTVVLYNANGLHKETWEPTIAHLVAEKGEVIDEIWSFEPVNHGDSALINTGKLSAYFEWIDQSRDALSFLLHYLPSQAISEALSTHLPRVSEQVSMARKYEGFRSRILAAVGHSWGGCTIVRAALACPAVFSSIIVIDPVIIPCFNDRSKHTNKLAQGAISRRTAWSSREEAHKLLKASPFFGRWDPAVLALYIDFAMYDAPGGGVQLKMSGLDEAACFANIRLPVEVWELLPALDNRIRLHWIMAGEGPIMMGGEDAARSTVWRRKTHTSNVRIPKAGHLITQEQPKALAHELNRFFSEVHGSSVKGHL